MKKLLALALVSCLLSLGTLSSHAGSSHADAAAPKAPEPIAGQGYRLVKDWTFGSSISDSKTLRDEFFTRYIYDGGKLDKLNDEWQRYRDNDNHEFKDGRLALVARVPKELKPGQIESGMLRSKWSGEYGYIEGRMKLPAAGGMWSGFWLNPQDQVWPPEIDIVEVVNNGRDTTRNSFHYVHSGDRKAVPTVSSTLDKFQSYHPGFDYAEGFHTFAVLWEPGRTRHYVDEKLVIDRRFEWKHQNGSDAGPAHVLVNLAVGGQWPGPPKRPEDFPARLEIEYIRVWQK